MNIQTVEDAITSLNYHAYEHGIEMPMWQLGSDGTTMWVEFCGFPIWNDDCDERPEVDPDVVDSPLMPLEQYLRLEGNKYMKQLADAVAAPPEDI